MISLILGAALAGDAALPLAPVPRDSLTPAAQAAFAAPVDATITWEATTARPAPRQSYNSGMDLFHDLNVINHEHGGFEPMAFRPKFRARATHADRVELDPEHARALGEGFYDGARVRVYQAVDGRLVLIRDATVAPGDHHASGWLEMRGQLSTLPAATTTRISLDASFLPNRSYWFCVRAVDRHGQKSLPSNVVSLRTGAACTGQNSPDPAPPWQHFDTDAPDKPAPPPAPANLRASTDGGIVTFTWDAVTAPNLAGYALAVSATDPATHHGFGLQLSSRQPCPDRIIQKDDIVFVDQFKRTITPSDLAPYCAWPAWRSVRSPFKSAYFQEPYALWSDGSCGYPAQWSFAPHPEPVPATFVGRGAACLRWSVAGPDLTGFVVSPYGGSKDGWYPSLRPGTYRVSAWTRGSGSASLVFTGPFAPKGVTLPYKQSANPASLHEIRPVDLPLADTWREVSGSFTVPAAIEDGLGYILVAFQGPGTMHLDNLRIWRDDHPYGEYHPTTLAHIRDSGMRYARTHEITVSRWGYGLDGITNDASGNNYSAGNLKVNSLFGMLHNLAKAGNVSPWMQIEMCLAEDEWLGFAEWFCAPYDPARDTPQQKPWAYKRWSMGQARPWVEVFAEFGLTFSNEAWNQTFAPYDWDWGRTLTDAGSGRRYTWGATCGLFNEHVIATLRKSPWWTPAVESKARYFICGWSVNLPFGLDAMRHSPSTRGITYANYVHNSGLGDPKVMDDFKRFYVMQWPLSGVTPHAVKELDADMRMRALGLDVEPGIYEYGYAYYVMPGDPKETKEVDQQLARSLIGAVAILDGALTMSRMGFQDQGFFTFSHRIGAWGSHTKHDFGGHAYPFWKALELYNHHGAGTFLDVRLASVPRWDFPAYEAQDNMDKVKRAAMPQAPLVSVHATAAGDRVSVFVISRKIDNFPIIGDDGRTAVTLHLPFAKAARITRHRLSGDPRSDDRFAELHRIETTTLPSSGFGGTLAIAGGLPPATIDGYVFEGVSTTAVNHPPRAAWELPESCLVGEAAPFRDRSSDPDRDRLTTAWKLGSQGASSEAAPGPVFTKAGFERIELTVTDAMGRSDTLIQHELPVDLAFAGQRWRFQPRFPQHLNSGSAIRDGEGRLVVEGSLPLPFQGSANVLSTTSAWLRHDVVFTATIAAVTGSGGLVLTADNKEGLNFGWEDHKHQRHLASVLLTAEGAVRVLAGRGEAQHDVLPPGSVRFPAEVRLSVQAGTATAAIRSAGVWRTVATFPNLADHGLMPGFATHGKAVLTVTGCTVDRQP